MEWLARNCDWLLVVWLLVAFSTFLWRRISLLKLKKQGLRVKIGYRLAFPLSFVISIWDADMAWQLILGDETIDKKKKTLREVLAEESSKTLLEKFATGFSIFLGPLFYFFSWLLILLVLLVLGFIRLVNAIFGRVARIYLFRRCS